MRTRLLPALGLCAALIGGAASAATITYTATSLGGSNWRYDYAVANDTLGAALAEFTVWFALGQYSNLAVAASPADWDSLVVQPDPGLPDAGFFDALALDAGIAPGASRAGFAVSFTYLGAGTPGAQSFDVVNPSTFAKLETGTTSPVPLPGAGWLAAVAALAAASRARRRTCDRPVG